MTAERKPGKRIVEPGSWKEAAKKTTKHFDGILPDVVVDRQSMALAFETIETLLLPKVIDGEVVSEPSGEVRIINKDHPDSRY